jgi:hypothetical protein
VGSSSESISEIAVSEIQERSDEAVEQNSSSSASWLSESNAPSSQLCEGVATHAPAHAPEVSTREAVDPSKRGPAEELTPTCTLEGRLTQTDTPERGVEAKTITGSEDFCLTAKSADTCKTELLP